MNSKIECNMIDAKSIRNRAKYCIDEMSIPESETLVINHIMDKILDVSSKELDITNKGYMSHFYLMEPVSELVKVAENRITFTLIWDVLRAYGYELIFTEHAGIEILTIKW